MKKIITLLTIVIVISHLTSCKRSITSPLTNTEATFAFDMEGPPTVYGQYYANTLLDKSDSIVVGIIVTKPGYYELHTDTIHGISFSVKGTLYNTGAQNITLYGTGIIDTSVEFLMNFITTENAASYTIVIPVGVPNYPITNAIFQFSGNTTCREKYFVVNQPLTSNIYAQVDVNVTTPGYYQIYSDTIDGFSFSSSQNQSLSTFYSTGIQTVYLYGSGVPNKSGVYTFNLKGNGYIGASFNTNVIQLSGGSIAYNCKINGGYKDFADLQYANATVYTSPVDSIIKTGTLEIKGYSGIASDSWIFSIDITNKDGSPVKAGTYTTNGNGYDIYVNYYYEFPRMQYSHSSTTKSNTVGSNQYTPFTINISKITSTEVLGTFSGKLVDDNNSTSLDSITNGNFDVPF